MDTDLQQLAAEAAGWFETRHRAPSGETYVVLRDGRPDWLYELVRDAHGDMLPDDWRYACIRAAIEAIRETDDADGYATEFSVGMADTYNADLIAWLGSHACRIGYVDQAQEDQGLPADDYGVMGAIMAGQYMEASEVYHSVLVSLRDELAV